MVFKNADQVQDLLDKAASTEDRLQTLLLLLNSKFSELGQVKEEMNRLCEKLESRSMDRARP